MDNYIKTRDWLRLSLSDLEIAMSLLNEEKLPAAVFHLQQSVEKGAKALLSFLGIEVKYTHFPAREIIENQILRNPEMVQKLFLDEKNLSLLTQLVQSAALLEMEETKPRYGEEVEDRIILPVEIYTSEKVRILFESGVNFWRTGIQFLRKFEINQINKILEEIDVQIGKFK
ncbi:MAG: HEPN domain-containing protein [Elusimicrobiota bacterium]